MSENLKAEDFIEKKDDSTAETAEQKTTGDANEAAGLNRDGTPKQDPLKTELERVQNKSKYTEKEKAEHSLRKNAERVKELGGDPTSILGIPKESIEADEDDNQPVTRGMLKKMQQENASKSALQLADEITHESERELVKYHLSNTIKSTGIPAEDLKLARALVNSVKNTEIIQEVQRTTAPKTHSNSSGVDGKKETGEITYTADELQMMKAPFNMAPAQILAARAGQKYSFKNSKV